MGPKNTGQNQFRWVSGSTKLYNLLHDLDYHNKSGASACKVLNFLPRNLHNFWWLGYFNGDGSIYHDGNIYRIVFSSCKEQDWTFFKKTCDELNIKYSYRIEKSQLGFGSIVKISQKKSVIIMGKYLFNLWEPKYGFKRKRDKFTTCLLDSRYH